MTATLDGYQRGGDSLARRVTDLEAAIEALSEVSGGVWIEQLRSALSGLEIVHALTLDEGRLTVITEQRDGGAESIAELRSLLDKGSSSTHSNSVP